MAATKVKPLIGIKDTGTVLMLQGTGDPDFVAGKGTLYIKVDATTTTTRLWVNTDADTTWTYFTSAA